MTKIIRPWIIFSVLIFFAYDVYAGIKKYPTKKPPAPERYYTPVPQNRTYIRPTIPVKDNYIKIPLPKKTTTAPSLNGSTKKRVPRHKTGGEYNHSPKYTAPLVHGHNSYAGMPASKVAAIRDLEDGGTKAFGRRHHGEHISIDQHKRRILKGLAPDGTFSPSMLSTSFKSGQYDSTLERVRHKNLYEPNSSAIREIKNSQNGVRQRFIILEHPEPVGDGFKGVGVPVSITGPYGEKSVAYNQTAYISDLRKTETKLEWNPQQHKWDIIVHHPVP